MSDGYKTAVNGALSVTIKKASHTKRDNPQMATAAVKARLKNPIYKENRERLCCDGRHASVDIDTLLFDGLS
ncbi:MAG: hypothetical protein WBI55_08455 [Eubacteriales bacterium]